MVNCSRRKQRPPQPRENVRVVVRIRPLSKKELEGECEEVITEIKGTSSRCGLLEVKGFDNKCFEFDSVMGENHSQRDVYENSGAFKAVTEDLFLGHNVTLFAYGQTGTGKTFTIGSCSDDDDEDFAGILPRASKDLFDTMQLKCQENGKIELSCIEIYNEEIRDLLNKKTHKDPEKKGELHHKVRENFNGDIHISGLITKEVSRYEQIGKILERASRKRVVASTTMNAASSRSHTIYSFKISGTTEGRTFTSKLTLVDLAGSERMKNCGTDTLRQSESIHINKSLLALGQVISALGDSKQRRPPYRDSKVTRLLQDSLGGSSRTIMLACISAADCNIEESLNTLRYATTARNIKNITKKRVSVKQISQKEALNLQVENQLLKQKILKLEKDVINASIILTDDDESAEDASDFDNLVVLEDATFVSSIDEEEDVPEIPPPNKWEKLKGLKKKVSRFVKLIGISIENFVHLSKSFITLLKPSIHPAIQIIPCK